MQLHMSEQDVIDACCTFVARHHRARLEDVQVELVYDDGFRADARIGWRSLSLSEQDMIDAIAEFLAEYHNFDPYRLDVQLQFPDESRIEAYIVARG